MLPIHSAGTDFTFNDCSELIVPDSNEELTWHANMRAAEALSR